MKFQYFKISSQNLKQSLDYFCHCLFFTQLSLCLQNKPSLSIIMWHSVIKEYKASGYTVYLLVNTILRNTLHLKMLYRQLFDQQAAPPTILNSCTKSPLTNAFVQLSLFLDQTNTISLFPLRDFSWAVTYLSWKKHSEKTLVVGWVME